MNTIVPTNVLPTDIAAGFAPLDDAGQAGSWFQDVLNELLADPSPTAIRAEKKPNKEQPSHSVDNAVNFIAALGINLPDIQEPAPPAPAKPAEAGEAPPAIGSINLSELDVKSIEIQIEAVPIQPANNKEKNLSTQGKCATADAASVSVSKSEEKPQAETWQQLFTTMSEGSARPLVEFVFKDRTPPVVREIGTSDLIFADPRVRLDPRAAMGSREEFEGEREKHTPEQPANSAAPQFAVLDGINGPFRSEIAKQEPPAPLPDVRERPPELPQPIARRVSIEIGEGNSRVMVTIHERAGDVSLKFHSAAEPLRAALQASVGSLVETLKRGEVPLANMDFRSGFAGNSDSSPRREKRPNAARRACPAAPDDTAEVDSISGKDTINIRG